MTPPIVDIAAFGRGCLTGRNDECFQYHPTKPIAGVCVFYLPSSSDRGLPNETEAYIASRSPRSWAPAGRTDLSRLSWNQVSNSVTDYSSSPSASRASLEVANASLLRTRLSR